MPKRGSDWIEVRAPWVLVCAWLFCAPMSARAAPPTDGDAATTLAADVHAMVTDLASQRDAIGGWPTQVQDAYASLQQLVTQFDAARMAGDIPTARTRYQALMRIAARISRWLVNHYEPANDQAPARDKVDALLTRLKARVDTLTQLASQAGKTLDLSAATNARTQVEMLRNSGTDAQLRTAVKALRDAVDSLQDMLSN